MSTSSPQRATRPPVVLSAYNAAASGLHERPRDEAAWYAALRADPTVDGLEIPTFGGSAHPQGISHLASLLHPSWTNVVSGMSGTLLSLRSQDDYGLASLSEDGRSAALADVEETRRTVAEMRAILGDESVRAVVLHSAPRADRGSATSLEKSLLQIVDDHWGPTTFLLEHADALVAGQDPQKGWQSLTTEIAVVERVRERTGADVRLLLNWGRAAIETRSALGAQQLIADAVASGLVGAVAMSGASGASHPRGNAWADVHMGLDTDEPASLLTAEAVHETMRTAPTDILFVGVKTGAPAGSGATPNERLQLSRSIIDCLEKR